jgi:hypothetical protein
MCFSSWVAFAVVFFATMVVCLAPTAYFAGSSGSNRDVKGRNKARTFLYDTVTRTARSWQSVLCVGPH